MCQKSAPRFKRVVLFFDQVKLQIVVFRNTFLRVAKYATDNFC